MELLHGFFVTTPFGSMRLMVSLGMLAFHCSGILRMSEQKLAPAGGSAQEGDGASGKEGTAATAAGHNGNSSRVGHETAVAVISTPIPQTVKEREKVRE